MASIQRIVSPLTNVVSYRAQVRVKGRPAQSETFPNRKEARQWAQSIETAIREGRHFPHAAARRTSFDALAKDYTETVLAEFDEKEKSTRTRQLKWWAEQFAGLALAEITADAIPRPATGSRPRRSRAVSRARTGRQARRSRRNVTSAAAAR